MRIVVTESGKKLPFPGGIRFAPNADVHSVVVFHTGVFLTKCGRKGHIDKVQKTRGNVTCEPCMDNGG